MKITYWISTLLLCCILAWSAYMFLFQKSGIDGVRALGFPDFFRIQLAVLKLIAIVLLLFPQIPFSVRQWAYAGAALFFLTAIIAHAANKDPISLNIINLIFLFVLVLSNWSLYKLN